MSDKHYQSPVNPEYSLCGDAFDGERGNVFDLSVFAQPGEVVTCLYCRDVIDACHRIPRTTYRAPKS